MDALQMGHITCLVLAVSIFALNFILYLPIDISALDSDCVSETIASNEYCDIVNDRSGIFLRAQTLTPAIVRAKLETLFRKNFHQFVLDQLDVLHAFDDTILNQRFIMCFAFMAMCMAAIELIAVKKAGRLYKNTRLEKLFGIGEFMEWRRTVIYFVLAKIPVLMFSIVPTPEPPVNKHYIDFGEYVRDTLSLRTRFTDTTLFGCFYCMLAIGHVSTNTIFYRFTKSVYLLERRHKTRLRFQPDFIVLFVTSTALLALAGILLGGSFVSIAFLHYDYSIILVLESARLFMRSLYVLDRLAQCVSASRMAQIESQKDLSAEEVADILSTGFQEGVTQNTFHNVYVHSTLFMSTFLSGWCLKNGVLTNQKLLALVFVPMEVQSMWTHLHYEKVPSTELL